MTACNVSSNTYDEINSNAEARRAEAQKFWLF